MDNAFTKLEEMDILFVLQHSPEKSEGMIMEVGWAIGRNLGIHVAYRKGIGYTYLPSMAEESVEWESIEDILQFIGDSASLQLD